MREAKKQGIEKLARFGLFSKGAVYVLTGIITAMAAFGLGGRTTDQKGAFSFVLEQPFGVIVIAVIALGLFAYMAWKIVQAAADAERKGTSGKGIAARIGQAASGVVYGGLGVYAASLVVRTFTGSGTLGSGGGEQSMAARILSQPFGQILLMLVAAGIAAFGFYEIVTGYKEKFMEKEKVTEMSLKEQKTMRAAGKAGYIARGIVFLIIAYFFFRAAIEANASQAQGTEGAFRFLQDSPSGPWLLGLAALGVAAYGVFMFMDARYHRIRVDRDDRPR